MATVEECAAAIEHLAKRLAEADPSVRQRASFDRTLSCSVRDLGVVFGGRLLDGQLVDLHQVEKADGQVRMTIGSDDLVDLIDGKLPIMSAWASGRVKIDASMMDLLRLRSVF